MDYEEYKTPLQEFRFREPNIDQEETIRKIEKVYSYKWIIMLFMTILTVIMSFAFIKSVGELNFEDNPVITVIMLALPAVFFIITVIMFINARASKDYEVCSILIVKTHVVHTQNGKRSTADIWSEESQAYAKKVKLVGNSYDGDEGLLVRVRSSRDRFYVIPNGIIAMKDHKINM